MSFPAIDTSSAELERENKTKQKACVAGKKYEANDNIKSP